MSNYTDETNQDPFFGNTGKSSTTKPRFNRFAKSSSKKKTKKASKKTSGKSTAASTSAGLGSIVRQLKSLHATVAKLKQENADLKKRVRKLDQFVFVLSKASKSAKSAK